MPIDDDDDDTGIQMADQVRRGVYSSRVLGVEGWCCRDCSE